MNPIKKKALIVGSIITAATAGTVAGIAVSIKKAVDNKPKYDFGLIVSPVNSLNYVLYSSSRDVVGSTIPPMFVTRPKKTDKLSKLLIKEALVLAPQGDPEASGAIPIAPQQANDLHNDSFDSYYLKNFEVESGVNSNVIINTDSTRKARNGFSVMVDSSIRWNDGTRLRASQFIDYIDMILDQNIGSNLIDEVLDLRIKGATEYVEAQRTYFTKYKEIYKNPSGVNNPLANGKTNLTWPSQVNGDAAEVAKISAAFKAVEIYGDEYSSRPYTLSPASSKLDERLGNSAIGHINTADTAKNAQQVVQIMKDKYKASFTGLTDEDVKDTFMTVQFKDSFVETLDFIKYFSSTNIFMPINKKDVAKSGGINAFGNKVENMPYIGAYKFQTGTLGKNGGLTLEKNEDFLYKADVFSRKIRLYFSTDPNVNYAMFKDGVIAKTPVPSIQVTEAFSDLEQRQYLSKQANASTEGLAFNLDKSTRSLDAKHDPLQYPSFRKAIFYALDREQILKILQQDSSLVKTNFSSTIGLIDELGNNVSGMQSLSEEGVTHIPAANPGLLDNLYTDSHGNIEPTINTHIVPMAGQGESVLKQSSLLERYSIDFMFESADRSDRTTNRPLARKFLEQFKREYQANTGQPFSTYEIKFIYGNGEDGENLGISMQNQMKETFGSEVTMILKGYSPEIYGSYVEQGKFDIVYKELAGMKQMSDVLNPTLYIKKLLIHDEASRGYGFLNNPTGGWTFDDFLARHPKGSAEEADIIQRLHLHQSDVDVIRELVKFTPYEETLKADSLLAAEKERIIRIKAWLTGMPYVQDGHTVTYNPAIVTTQYNQLRAMRFNLLAQFDKFVIEDSPVIPMTIGGQGWQLSRYSSFTQHGSVHQFEFGYDKQKPPKDELKRVI